MEPTVDNLLMILRMDEDLKGIRYNKLQRYVAVTAPLPWRQRCGEWKNDDDAELYIYLSIQYNNMLITGKDSGILPELKVGNNTITWTGTVDAVKIKTNWREI